MINWKESKLTKWTLIGCALLLTAYFSTEPRAEEEQNVSATAQVCVAANYIYEEALVPGVGDNNELKELVLKHHRWWLGFLAAWEGVSEDDALKLAQDEYRGLADWYGRANPTVRDEGLKDLVVACYDTREEYLELIETIDKEAKTESDT